MSAQQGGPGPDKWAEIRDLFDRAADLPEDAVSAFLDGATSDPFVRAEVLRLVRFDQAQPPFLREPAARLLESPVQIRPGDVLLDRFRIVRLISAGGMGQVFEAEDLESRGHRIALKALDPHYYGSELLRDQFRSELLLARKILHPNVCRVHELHHDNAQGLLLLTMAYLEGDNLAVYRKRRGALPAAMVDRFAQQIAGALAAAHQENVLHCDLKPSNVIITENRDGETAVVTDFGLARPIAAASGSVMPYGTPGYLAPEVRTGNPPSFASDVYSFGVLLYEMITGTLPPESPQRRRPTGKWTSIIDRCLATDPQQRPADGTRLLDAVNAVSNRARRWRLFAAGAVATLLLVALLGYRYQQPPPPVTTLAILPFETMSSTEPDVSLANALPIAAAVELSRLRTVRAIGSASTVRYRGSGKSLQQIARELGVEIVVTGKLHTDRGFLLVDLAMADATGQQKWSRTLRRPLSESPSMRQDVVIALATALPVRFDPRVFDSATATTVPEAFEQFSLGSKRTQERDKEGRIAAMTHFQEALRLDPHYTRARTALANAYFNLAGEPEFPYVESLEMAEREVLYSLSEDPNLAETHWVYGSILQALHWDWENAEQHFRRSIELSPGFVHGHQRLATLLSNRGRAAEAIVEIRLAAQLDPLGLAVRIAYANCLLRAGQIDEAEEQIRNVESLSPGDGRIPVLRAQKSVLAGDWASAANFLESAAGLLPNQVWIRGAYIQALFRSGRTAQAKALRQNLEQNNRSAMALAHAYLGEGRVEDAIRQVDLARRQHDPQILSIAVEPLLRDLRSHPGFIAFLKEMRLP